MTQIICTIKSETLIAVGIIKTFDVHAFTIWRPDYTFYRGVLRTVFMLAFF